MLKKYFYKIWGIPYKGYTYKLIYKSCNEIDVRIFRWNSLTDQGMYFKLGDKKSNIENIAAAHKDARNKIDKLIKSKKLRKEKEEYFLNPALCIIEDLKKFDPSGVKKHES